MQNSCGLVSRYIPKKANIASIDGARIKWIESRLNDRPRKRRNYQMPAEVLGILCGALVAECSDAFNIFCLFIANNGQDSSN